MRTAVSYPIKVRAHGMTSSWSETVTDELEALQKARKLREQGYGVTLHFPAPSDWPWSQESK